LHEYVNLYILTKVLENFTSSRQLSSTVLFAVSLDHPHVGYCGMTFKLKTILKLLV